MHANSPRTRSADLGRALLAALTCWALASPPLQAQEWTEDRVTGSCKSLLDYQSGSGVALDGKHYAGRWGITEGTVFIGSKAITDSDVMDEIALQLTAPKPATGAGRRGQVCRQTAGLAVTFRAQTRVGAIEWQHGRKPDSACAKEWQRVRNIIRSHEPKHVQDIADVVAAANRRIATHAPLEGCGATPEAAAQAVGQQLLQLLRSEFATIDKAAKDKARARDVETATINCKLCDEGLSFKEVTIDCVMPLPGCKMRTGQKLSGRTCGDPTSASWTIAPHYFAEGCGAPASGSQGDKPFENDCVAAGSDEEKRRAEIYRSHQKIGAGGWMCVYSPTPTPKITIRNFRLSMCQGPSEQSITVDAEPAEDCNAAPPKPAPARPVS